MVPIDKVKEIITKYDSLEKELSSGNIAPQLFAKTSKEYSNLGNIIEIAREYINFENEINEYTRTTEFTDTLFKGFYQDYLVDTFSLKRRLKKVTAYLPLRIFTKHIVRLRCRCSSCLRHQSNPPKNTLVFLGEFLESASSPCPVNARMC